MSKTIHLQDLHFSISRDLSAIHDAWQTLNFDPLNSLHQSPAWCQSWAKAHGLELIFLQGTMNGKCYMLLPLQETRRLFARALELPAAGYNNIATGMVDEALQAPQDAAARQLAQKKIATAISPISDLLSLSNVALDWRGRLSPFTGLPNVENQNQAFQLPLLGSFEETLKQLNAKRRRKKFRISQKAAEELGGYRYCIAESEADKKRILQLFLAQKAARFASQGLPDAFANPKIQDFLMQLVSSASEIGKDSALELHYLELCGEHSGTVVSITGISRKGDHAICQFGSIDDQFAGDMSPGELLFYHVIERENKLGSKLFDFGIGDQRYKRSWCPVSTQQHDILIAASIKGRVLANALRIATKAKSFIKNHPRLYQFVQKIRRQQSQGTGEAASD